MASAMEGQRGHEKREGWVQRMHGREREQMGRRGGSGAVLYRHPAAHRGCGARVAVATAWEARGEGEELSTAFVGLE